MIRTGVQAGLAESLLNISVDLNPATDLATITLEGPAEVWFGVGLGAHGKFNPADPSSGLSMLGTPPVTRSIATFIATFSLLKGITHCRVRFPSQNQ